MKKKILAILLLLAVVIMQFACNNNRVIKPDENTVIIEVSSKDFDIKNKNLLDYMTFLQNEGELSFEMSSGMVTKLNGKENGNNTYWMLYTSDTENANIAWGQIEYNGNIYGSAVLGASGLNIKEGCLYIWAYQSF